MIFSYICCVFKITVINNQRLYYIYISYFAINNIFHKLQLVMFQLLTLHKWCSYLKSGVLCNSKSFKEALCCNYEIANVFIFLILSFFLYRFGIKFNPILLGYAHSTLWKFFTLWKFGQHFVFYLQIGLEFFCKFWRSDQRFRRSLLHPIAS